MSDYGAPSSLGYEPDEPSNFVDQALDDLVHSVESVADNVSLFSALPEDVASEVEGVDFNFRNAFTHALHGLEAETVKLPWEEDSWKAIFEPSYDLTERIWPSLEPRLKVPRIENPSAPVSSFAAASADILTGSAVPTFAKAVSERQDRTWMEKREADMSRALRKWFVILTQHFPEDWPCVAAVAESGSEDHALTVLEDYLSGKAPATLVKRANSLLFVIDRAHSIGVSFPFSEPEFYYVLKTLKAADEKSSRLKSVVEAVTFARHVFSAEQLEPLASSRRCRGAIAARPVERGNQAAPLSCEDLKHLHDVLDKGQPWDKVFAGACLFCVYARARWSDFVHATKIVADTDFAGKVCYLEAPVFVHKTMHSAGRRFKYLDLVASAHGFHGDSWAETWMKARRAVGLDDLPSDASDGVMPAPKGDGSPSSRPLDADEAGIWLRLLLGLPVLRGQGPRLISTHSLKATILSMAAKRGIGHVDRLAMGHHAHPFRMSDVYAREAQARVIRIVDDLIAEVRRGYFKPDETRAGRFDLSKDPTFGSQNRAEAPSQDWPPADDSIEGSPFPPDPPPAAPVCEGDATNPPEVDSDHDTSSSSSGEDDAAENPSLGAGKAALRPPSVPSGYKFVQNLKTRMLHVVDERWPSSLMCGRLSREFAEPKALTSNAVVCAVCRRSMQNK